MTSALAILYHDPPGALDTLVSESLPLLQEIYAGIAICASPQANPNVLDRWAAGGALIEVESRGEALPVYRLGQARLTAVTLALQTGAAHVHYCDGDRVLHWARHYPDELRQAAQRISEADFTVLGRSQRAFESHPAMQRDTEQIINEVFARATGLDWDLGSGSRGLSRRAIDYLNAHCDDATIGVDASWPLCLQAAPAMQLAYWTAEGLEFETGDRHDQPDADSPAYAAWLDSLDADPNHWSFRLLTAHLIVAQIAAYTSPS